MACDVVVIGAGPAGLMAAKTAAEQGLRVTVIEKRRDISRITRACSQVFIMDALYEGESFRVEPGKLVFPRNGFTVDYDGPTMNITDKYYISPRGHRIHFANEDRSPIGIKFDKGKLLHDLLEKCARAGVEFRSSTLACDAADSAGGIEVRLSHRGAAEILKAKKMIIADGVNSRIAAALHMNQGRTLFSTALCLRYTLEGAADVERTACKFHMGLAYQSKGPVIIVPAMEKNMCHLMVMGNKDEPPGRIYRKVVASGPLAAMLAGARVVEKIGCGVKAFTSMPVPYRGNALAVGDAAAFIEVETQGALMCGFRAGNAAGKELAGEPGFAEYTTWWQTSFEFNTDEYLRVAQGYALVPTYTDDELDYLFALTEDQILPGTISQYASPKMMWDSMLRHWEKIVRERPELAEKIKRNQDLTLKGTF